MLLPASAAQPLPPLLEHMWEVPADGKARFLDLDTELVPPASGDAYLKVVPRDVNPLLLNGTPPTSGWWLDVGLQGPGRGSATGVTNGSQVIELGPVSKDETYRLRARLRVPSDALEDPTTFTVNLALAVRHGPVQEESSGGRVDPSWGIRLVVVVIDAPAQGAEHGAVRRIPALSPFAVVVAVTGAAALFRDPMRDHGGRRSVARRQTGDS